jgi:hypothetical protein
MPPTAPQDGDPKPDGLPDELDFLGHPIRSLYDRRFGASQQDMCKPERVKIRVLPIGGAIASTRARKVLVPVDNRGVHLGFYGVIDDGHQVFCHKAFIINGSPREHNLRVFWREFCYNRPLIREFQQCMM